MNPTLPFPRTLADGRPLPSQVGRELRKVCAIARKLNERNCLPATSGNMSVRFQDMVMITRSGIHKGQIQTQDFLPVGRSGAATFPSRSKPSDETLVHLALYESLPQANCVIHCHPPQLDQWGSRSQLELGPHELLKALGVPNHEQSLVVPAMPNTQDMSAVAAEVQLRASKPPHIGFPKEGGGAFVLCQHGIYVAGKSAQESFHFLEALLTLTDRQTFNTENSAP